MKALTLLACMPGLMACSERTAGSRPARAAATFAAAVAAAPAPAAEARRVWSGPVTDISGSPSPDGTLLTFTDWTARTLNVVDLQSGGTRALAHPAPGTSQFPEYSRFAPDGRSIAYTWFNGSGYELRVLSLDGGDPRVLVPDQPDVRYLRPGPWTPDGHEVLIAVDRADGSLQIGFADTRTGAVRIVRSVAWKRASRDMPAISPDGRHVAMSERTEAGAHRIIVTTIAGATETSVIESVGDNAVLGWANDGRLFHTRRADGTQAAYAVPMRDGKPAGPSELLAQDFGRAIPMAITSDGRLFYGELTGTWDVYVASIDPDRALLLAPPVRATHRLLGFNQGIDWTRDGRQAAYLMRRGATPASPAALVLRDEHGAEVREVEPDLDYINAAIRWSPDGRRIAAQATDRNGRTGLQLIDPRTGAYSTVFTVNPAGGMVHRPAWTPDGSALFYALVNIEAGLGYRIMRRDLRTNTEQVVYSAPRLSSVYALSADASRLVVVAELEDATLLSVVPADGGAARPLVRVAAGQRIISVEWSRDGRHVYYVQARATSGAVPEVWIVPAPGGPPRAVGLAMKGLMGLRAHPDGRRLGFTGGEVQAEVWVLESARATARQVRP